MGAFNMRDLLVDVGSTFIKYAISDGGSLKTKRIPFPERMASEDGHYWVKREHIERAILSIVDEGVERGCRRLFISVQMHGFLWRCEDGCLTDYLSWRDKSGDVEDPILATLDFVALGTAPKSNLPLCKRSLLQDATVLYTLGSYIAYLLTGRNVTHTSDGCASGFFLADTGDACPLDLAIELPTVLPSLALVGTYGPLAVYTPLGDHQVSYLGSGASHSGYLLNIGTATQLSCLSEGGDPPQGCEARPYFEKGVRLLTVSGLTGGAELYGSGSALDLCKELENALTRLPPKKTVFLGGGGAEGIKDALRVFFEKRGIHCIQTSTAIGMEGLRMIAAKKTKVGTMLSELAFTSFPLIAKNTGLDFMIIDNEHGAFDYSTLGGLAMNASLVSLPLIVRLPDNSRAIITKLADMGVTGFLLPMVNEAKDIKEVVRYAKYAPIGERGVSTTRAHTHYSPPPLAEYMESANERVRVYAQIETRAGVENIESILSLYGVDGVFIGPNDLSVSLNCIGEKEPIYRAMERVAAAASSKGLPWGIITADRELIAQAKSLGVDMISSGSELNMLINGCKKIKDEIQ